MLVPLWPEVEYGQFAHVGFLAPHAHRFFCYVRSQGGAHHGQVGFHVPTRSHGTLSCVRDEEDLPFRQGGKPHGKMLGGRLSALQTSQPSIVVDNEQPIVGFESEATNHLFGDAGLRHHLKGLPGQQAHEAIGRADR